MKQSEQESKIAFLREKITQYDILARNAQDYSNRKLYQEKRAELVEQLRKLESGS